MIFVAKPIFNFFGREEGSMFDPMMLMGCQLAGLVSISSCCNTVSPESSIFIGVIAGVIFMIAKRVLNRLEFDDPLNIVSIHLFCGLWGLCAAGIFD